MSLNFHLVKDCSLLDLLMTVPSFCFRLLRRHSFWHWAAIVVGGFAVVIPTLVVAASDSLSLAGKAQLFEVDLAERFLENGQVRVRRACNCRPPPWLGVVLGVNRGPPPLVRG